MSDFLKDPKFQPDDQVRNFIDSLFAEPPKDLKPKKSSLELTIPDAPAMTDEEQESALKIARNEFEVFKDKFMKLQDEVSDMVIYSYLFPNLQDFGDACQDLVDLIEDNFDRDKFTQAGEEKHSQALKIRANVLAEIFRRYNAPEEE